MKLTSDEPDASITPNDMAIDSSSEFRFKPEREGTRDGRVYSVHFTMTDVDGNAGTSVCRVQVKKRQGSGPAVDSGPQACVGTCP